MKIFEGPSGAILWRDGIIGAFIVTPQLLLSELQRHRIWRECKPNVQNPPYHSFFLPLKPLATKVEQGRLGGVLYFKEDALLMFSIAFLPAEITDRFLSFEEEMENKARHENLLTADLGAPHRVTIGPWGGRNALKQYSAVIHDYAYAWGEISSGYFGTHVQKSSIVVSYSR